jgi:hypothetical protein
MVADLNYFSDFEFKLVEEGQGGWRMMAAGLGWVLVWRGGGLAVARLWLAARRPTACVRRSNRLDVLEMKDDVHDEVEGEL